MPIPQIRKYPLCLTYIYTKYHRLVIYVFCRWYQNINLIKHSSNEDNFVRIFQIQNRSGLKYLPFGVTFQHRYLLVLFFPIHKILSLTPHNLLSEVYFLISNRKTLITHYHVSYFNTWWKCFVNCVQYLHNYVYNTTWCRVVYGLCTVISNNVFWELDISAKNLNQFRDLNVYCINGLRPSFPMKKLVYEGACLVLIHVACHWFENGDHHWTLNYWNLNYVLGAE